MAISGSVGVFPKFKGSISQGNELVVTRVAVPGPQMASRCIWFF